MNIPIKRFIKSLLTLNQIKIISKIRSEKIKKQKASRRRSSNVDLIIGRILSSKLILILGCQRSGTTLTYMLISSHPKIDGKNENETGYDFPNWKSLIRSFLKGHYFSCKLPTKTPELESIIHRFPHATVVWVTRNSLSVVSSMKALKMDSKTNWLQNYGEIELLRHSKLFTEIMAIDLERADQISLGAYIWKYKLKTRQLYIDSQLRTFPLDYEDLVANPRKEIVPMLKDLGLDWDDKILVHEEVHRGKRYPGNNVGDRRIDQSRINPTLILDEDEIKRVRSILED